MTAVNGGPNPFVSAVFSSHEVQDMYTTNGQLTMWTDTNRNHVLLDYARWEYGTTDTGWLIASARARRRKVKRRGLARRLRYFLNSFRGFAAFDVRGSDDRDST